MDLKYFKERQKYKRNLKILEQQYIAYNELKRITSLNSKVLNTHSLISDSKFEIKNKSLIDSIKYYNSNYDIKRKALIKMQRIFPESFMIYHNKDMFSGDFFWFHETKNEKIAVLIDYSKTILSPSFLSVLADKTLNKIISNNKINSPIKVLFELENHLNDSSNINFPIKDTSLFNKLGIIICVFRHRTQKVEFATLNRPFFQQKNGHLITYKASKNSSHNNIDSENLIISYKLKQSPKDTFYFTTAGLENWLKRDHKSGELILKSRLQTVAHKTLETQKNEVKNTLIKQKSENIQNYDALLIGIKV